ncbi:myosin heavy chain kinase D [Tenebrio molitor]|uniref:myosin heavy chain kinase D n=1 Tax=Tenebrio molitor TaxID=7067 RepID=UPI00362492F8
MPLHVACKADDSNKHEYDVNQIIFHKGKLFTAADDGKVKVWTPDLKFLQEVQAHPCSIFSVTASDDTLYTCSNDGTVKSWDLNTLQDKKTLVKDEEVEFWKVKYDKGVLYIGDDQGNMRIYKNEIFFGSINVAIPVKDLAVKENLVFASKDHDIIVTDLHLNGEKPTFGVKATIVGRGPIILIEDKSIFMSRTGRDILLNQIGENQHIKELSTVSEAHDMIVNAGVAANWDGKCSVFTGGWDKIVKQWKVENNSLKADGSCAIDFIINSMIDGEKGQVYVAGSDGHIARLDL